LYISFVVVVVATAVAVAVATKQRSKAPPPQTTSLPRARLPACYDIAGLRSCYGNALNTMAGAAAAAAAVANSMQQISLAYMHLAKW
jgi:hypothetical protein